MFKIYPEFFCELARLSANFLYWLFYFQKDGRCARLVKFTQSRCIERGRLFISL